MEINRRRSAPEASGGSPERVRGTLGNAAIGASPGRKFAPWRMIWTFSKLCAGVDETKSLEVSSSRLRDSGPSLQNRPKISANTMRKPNFFRNRIGLQLAF